MDIVTELVFLNVEVVEHFPVFDVDRHFHFLGDFVLRVLLP